MSLSYDPRGVLSQLHLSSLLVLVHQADKAILDIYRHYDPNQAMVKADDSPLTEADLASHHILTDGLSQITFKRPNGDSFQIPVVSEENISEIPTDQRLAYDYYWLIDPLDGTKEFLKKNDEFTVNVALIYQNQPILGIVSIPCQNMIYYATKNAGAYKTPTPGFQYHERLRVRSFQLNSSGIRIMASRSHLNEATEKLIAQFTKPTLIQAGSSLKFLRIAEGKADVYPRLAPTMEWDTAASQIIVTEAGGQVIQLDKANYLNWSSDQSTSVDYSKNDLHNPFFLVTGEII